MSAATALPLMNWDCRRDGCHNRYCRLKFQFFAGCFPRNIAPTDIDFAVEVDGRFLLQEWKSQKGGSDIPTGQRLFFERLTKANPEITALAVRGDCEWMNDVQGVAICRDGKFNDWRACDWPTLYRWTQRWGLGQ
jgi:hypothetical protein